MVGKESSLLGLFVTICCVYLVLVLVYWFYCVPYHTDDIVDFPLQNTPPSPRQQTSQREISRNTEFISKTASSTPGQTIKAQESRNTIPINKTESSSPGQIRQAEDSKNSIFIIVSESSNPVNTGKSEE